ncbi:MAG: hypothetical protein WCK78_18090 [Paludibacter sp.]
MKIAGIVIIILGLGLIVFTTFSYFSTKYIVQIANVQIRATHPYNLSWLPFIGLAVMVIGGYVMLKSKNRSI